MEASDALDRDRAGPRLLPGVSRDSGARPKSGIRARRRAWCRCSPTRLLRAPVIEALGDARRRRCRGAAGAAAQHLGCADGSDHRCACRVCSTDTRAATAPAITSPISCAAMSPPPARRTFSTRCSASARIVCRGWPRVLGWLDGEAVQRALTRLLGQDTVRSHVVEALVRNGAGVVAAAHRAAARRGSRHAAGRGRGAWPHRRSPRHRAARRGARRARAGARCCGRARAHRRRRGLRSAGHAAWRS